eukprot:m.359456 g.359456  ORF g.359456 m.359456 type:complete len:268 (+) comp18583_c0_seq1:76-879(+)
MDTLSQQSQDDIVKFLRFSRTQRAQCVHDVTQTFDELKESRLQDSTYTVEDVSDMIEGLSVVISSDVESELIRSAHANALLLQQVFTQAEKWKLNMNLDMGQMEDSAALKEVADFEQKVFLGLGGTKKLEPLVEAAAPALVQQEMDRLKAELEASQTALAEQRSLTKASQEECIGLKSRVKELEAQLGSASSAPASSSGVDSAQLAELQKEITELKASNASLAAQVEETTQALELKVSATPQFKNLKAMLDEKNQQIKQLRADLADK